jgi:heat shock protein HtpX
MTPNRAILPLDRAAENLRRTRLLLALFAVIALPSVAYVGQYVAFVFLLWMVPLFGGLGWVAFLALDFLLVLALMVIAFRWLYSSATRRLLRSVDARPLGENEAPEFARLVQNMSIASGIPLPALFVIEERAPNLLAIGLSPADSALVATRGLLRALDRRELEGAVAHAYAQIGNGDTRLDTLLATGVRFLKVPANFVLWVCRGLGRIATRFGAVGWGCLVVLAGWLLVPLALSVVWGLTDPDFWWICWIALSFLVYIFFVGPALAALAARRVGRERKHLADAEAVQLTRFPVGLARALAKVDAAGSAYAGAPFEAANLYFADPVAGGSGWWALITDSHPPAAERVEIVSRLGGVVPPGEVSDAAMEGLVFAARESDPVTATIVREPEPEIGLAPASLTLIGLLEDVPLLSSPRAGSAGRGTVKSGTRVTVLTDTDEFVEVATPDDRVGWISKRARFDILGPMPR